MPSATTMASGRWRMAGSRAAKRTAGLIPLCHPLPLDRVTIELAVDDEGVTVTATAQGLGSATLQVP